MEWLPRYHYWELILSLLHILSYSPSHLICCCEMSMYMIFSIIIELPYLVIGERRDGAHVLALKV